MTAAIKQLIRAIPDFPRPGIMFRDITPLVGDPGGLRRVTEAFAPRYAGKVDKFAAIEARGFIFGAALAQAVGAGFVPVRKSGKLPGKSIAYEYALEYGTSRIELHVDAVERGERIVVLDDLLATGGTALAAVALLEQLGAAIVECAFVVELVGVGGRAKLEAAGHGVHALCEFTDDEG